MKQKSNSESQIPKIFREEELQKLYEEMRKAAKKENIIGKAIFL